MVLFFAILGWIVLSLPFGMWVGRKLKQLNIESEALQFGDGRACLSPRSSSSGGG